MYGGYSLVSRSAFIAATSVSDGTIWLTRPTEIIVPIDARTDQYATELLDALDRAAQIQPITDRDPSFDEVAAYAVNRELYQRRRARGEKPIGRKIGFTNRTIWPEYGVYTPMWAHVYDTTVTFLDSTDGTLAIG